MGKSKKAKRFNKGKLRYDLINPISEKGLVEVLTNGANKYGDNNWEKGMEWSTVIASLKRHLSAIELGEDYDKESGLKHIDHVQANAHFLSAYYSIAPQYDNRKHSYLNNLKIGLDIDDVLADWSTSWIKRWNMNVPDSWLFDRKIQKRFKKLKKRKELDNFYLELEPLLDPKDIPFEPYCYITSRPVSKKISEKWLDKHGFPAAPVYCVGLNKTKVDVAIKAKIDIFVDDKYQNFVELNNAGIPCYLFDKPHNQRYNVGYKRIKQLYDIKKR